MRRALLMRSAATQRGVAAVEFALVAIVFFTLLLGAFEVARVLWVWNAAGEATRLGARLAVVCDLDDSVIKTRMRDRLSQLSDANITLTYLPAGCATTTCQSVSVSLSGLTESTVIPFIDFAPTLPPFRTTLSRESMSSANNPACS
jgi:hypothetical protein